MKERLLKLADAFDSGKYKPHRSALRSSDNRFCAQGVMCDVYDNSRWKWCKYSYIYDAKGREAWEYFGIPRTLISKSDLSEGVIAALSDEMTDGFECDDASLVYMHNNGVKFSTLAKVFRDLAEREQK